MLSFLLGKYLGMEWLDHMVSVCLTFEEAAELFCKVVVLCTVPPAAPPRSYSEVSSLVLDTLMGVWWHLIVS